ncbi:MAG: hypothetical protein AABY22_26845 [Nanoarchaeota archaeon]
MKTEINKTIFKCDSEDCPDVIEIPSNTGFPYDKGWLYLYNFNVQVGIKDPKDRVIAIPQSPKNRLTDQDKHFSSLKCFKKFMQKELAEVEAIVLKKEDFNEDK